MLRTQPKQISFFTSLYHKIPKNHILKRINSVISFNFVNNVLKESYCSNFGRPAKEPEMMLKILMIQYLYNLSDEAVIDEINVNLAFMEFIGINPEDDAPCPSLLSKFRTTRLSNISLDDIIIEIVHQCIEKGIIKEEDGLAVDTTHIEANTTKKVPERIMKHLALKIFKESGTDRNDIPDYKQIEDHKEAKQTMKQYLEDVIEEYQDTAPDATSEALQILSSDLFIEQKGIRSLVDKDARVGSKSKTQQFFGYKAEVVMTTESGLITAITVNPGSYVDGDNFETLYNLTESSGLTITDFCGDKAYFRKGILDKLREESITPYIPVSASAYKINEELYAYNKDSDQWLCVMGNETVRKTQVKRQKRGKEQRIYHYYFEREKCRNCPHRAECIKGSKSIAKILIVGENASEYYEHNQWAKTAEFKTGYKKRAKIEPKNAELKRFHGLARARGYGLVSVSKQAKLTALAVNLKRICKLISPLNPKIQSFLSIKFEILYLLKDQQKINM